MNMSSQCSGVMEDGWYVIRPAASSFQTPFLARPCAEIRVWVELPRPAWASEDWALEEDFGPPNQGQCTLRMELIKEETVLVTHEEVVSPSSRARTCLRLKGLPLLWLSGPGDRFQFSIDGLGRVLSAALSSKPAKSKDHKRKVITKSTLRPACGFRLWSKFGFCPPPAEPEQRTLSVLDLALAGQPFAIKNAATSSVLEWIPHAPPGLMRDLPGVATRSPHYRPEQLWRVVGLEPAEDEGLLEVILVNAADYFIVLLEMRSVEGGFYSLRRAGRAEVLDECVPEGHRAGCRGLKFSREASPPVSKQLWLLELPHQNLLAFLYGAGLLNAECSPEVYRTPAGRTLSDPSLVRLLAQF